MNIDIKPADLDFLRRLSTLTNVVPLIAKSDCLAPEEAQALKASVATQLRNADIRPFLFSSDGSPPSSPYTVCSAPSNDDENMDASLLMSPEYVRPLISSELSTLVHQIFDKDNVSWLRHLAAMKLVHSQKRMKQLSNPVLYPNSPSSLISTRSPSSYPTSQISSSSTSQAVISYASGASSYVQARIADHTQREEKLAQLRLAKWAGDLQRCLQDERARYETVSRGERALWLTQRLGECVDDGSLVPVRGLQRDVSSMRAEPGEKSAYGLLNARDPLGLLGWDEVMRRRGWIAFQVAGGFGVLGAMAVWMIRTWGAGADAYSGWTWAWWGGKV